MTLLLLCDQCRMRIDAKGGFASIDVNAAYERAARYRVWRSENRVADPKQGPPTVGWRLLHEQCDAQPERATLTIRSDRLADPMALAIITARHATTTWWRHTSWPQFIAYLLFCSPDHYDQLTTATRKLGRKRAHSLRGPRSP